MASRAREAHAGARGRRGGRGARGGPRLARHPYAERCELMRAVAAGIGERHLELAAVVSLETGKTRTESILEVQEAVDLITTYADLMEENEGYLQAARQLRGRRAQHRRPASLRRLRGDARRSTSPSRLAVNMPRAALIAGNTRGAQALRGGAVVGRDPRRDRARRAGLPPGVLNVIHGGPDDGARAGRGAGRRRRVHRLGRGRPAIARALQEGPFARPALTEMGGKNPAIVTAQADLDRRG